MDSIVHVQKDMKYMCVNVCTCRKDDRGKKGKQAKNEGEKKRENYGHGKIVSGKSGITTGDEHLSIKTLALG